MVPSGLLLVAVVFSMGFSLHPGIKSIRLILVSGKYDPLLSRLHGCCLVQPGCQGMIDPKGKNTLWGETGYFRSPRVPDVPRIGGPREAGRIKPELRNQERARGFACSNLRLFALSSSGVRGSDSARGGKALPVIISKSFAQRSSQPQPPDFAACF